MFFNLENPSDSEDDCDYEPPADELISEEEPMQCCSDAEKNTKGKTKKKQSSSKAGLVPKSNSTEVIKSLTNSVTYEKKRVDDVYESFLKEVATKEKNESLSSGISFSESNKSSPVEINCKKYSCNTSTVNTPEKLGEIMEKSVTKNYNDAPNFISDSSCVSSSLTDKYTTASATIKRKGLESVLNILNKKQKTTTLAKSLLDWKKFKEEEGIEEEIASYNRGKGGFIERKRFLERSDLRSFEIEREVRLTKRETKAKNYA